MNRAGKISLSDISFRGGGLRRPECVLTHESGLIFAADWTGAGGVAIVTPGGNVTRHLARRTPRPLHPNGIALEPGGSFLLTELSPETGGVWRLYPDGSVEPVLLDIGGDPLPPTNYAHIDASNRVWITVSTRLRPRDLAYRRHVADGFIVLLSEGRARIVAEGLGYTNECLASPDGRFLYVNETFGRRLSRFEITGDGLGRRETFVAFGPGTFPDGLAFDAEGGIWVTSIVSNRVIRVSPDGDQQVLVEDADEAHLAWVEEAYIAGQLGRPHLDTMKSRKLRNVSSLAFGGPGMRTAYLGCLLGDAVAQFTSPLPGLPPVHFTHDLGDLAGLAASPNSVRPDKEIA